MATRFVFSKSELKVNLKLKVPLYAAGALWLHCVLRITCCFSGWPCKHKQGSQGSVDIDAYREILWRSGWNMQERNISCENRQWGCLLWNSNETDCTVVLLFRRQKMKSCRVLLLQLSHVSSLARFLMNKSLYSRESNFQNRTIKVKTAVWCSDMPVITVYSCCVKFSK